MAATLDKRMEVNGVSYVAMGEAFAARGDLTCAERGLTNASH